MYVNRDQFNTIVSKNLKRWIPVYEMNTNRLNRVAYSYCPETRAVTSKVHGFLDTMQNDATLFSYTNL